MTPELWVAVITVVVPLVGNWVEARALRKSISAKVREHDERLEDHGNVIQLHSVQLARHDERLEAIKP